MAILTKMQSVGALLELYDNRSIRCIGSPGDIQFRESEVFVPGVEAAWSALQRQYAGQISDAEVDYLFACFVLGLTTPAYSNQDPSLHFDVCRALVLIKLPPDRADPALYSVPAPIQAGVESARELIESKGVKMGRALQDEWFHREVVLTPRGSSAASARLSSKEGDA